MTRDMDLIRAILLWIEARPEGHNVNWKLEIEGYTAEQIGYHCYLLAQAGLIEAVNGGGLSSKSPSYIPIKLTWDGHEFLDAAKDDGLWKQAKEQVLGPAGGAAFSLLLAWLKAKAAEKLGISL